MAHKAELDECLSSALDGVFLLRFGSRFPAIVFVGQVDHEQSGQSHQANDDDCGQLLYRPHA
jgi:hypothetical protein